MKADFDQALAPLLKNEGGFVNDPTDPGGATNHGISLRYLKTVGDMDGDGFPDGDIDHDGDVDEADIRGLPPAEVSLIYRKGWWEKYGYAEQEQTVANKLLDMAVNMGARQAHLLAQRACLDCSRTVHVDGVMGPATHGAIRSINPGRFLDAIRQRCCDFYRQLVRMHPDFDKYLNGWLRRGAA